jgi:hypothetical protein
MKNHISLTSQLKLTFPLTAAVLAAVTSSAQSSSGENPPGGGGPASSLVAPASGGAASANPLANYFSTWFDRVSQIQAEQPHWMTPLVTVTPRLEEELRYDEYQETLPGGKTLNSYGGGKGLEFIPAENVEVILGVPSWQTENTSPQKQGWTDENFLVKYRLLAANEENGNYILTAFLGLSVPTGSAAFTQNHYVVTPTLAFGKGWGNFDFQSTVGVALPDNGGAPQGAGTPFLLNTAFQYRLLKFLWPEAEVNYTGWANGAHDGLNQVFLTPGLILGRIPIAGRLGLSIGVGYQVAVTDRPLYRNNLLFSVRLPF